MRINPIPVLSVFAVLLLSFSITAAAFIIPANQNAKDNAKAPENSPAISDSWALDRVDFVHYAKPSGPSKPQSNSCYKLMGVKWGALPVSYAINPSNPQALDEASVASAISASAGTWDAATSRGLFNAPTTDYTAQYGVQNYVNAVDFGAISDSNTIAVTSVWYNRFTKRIVEFDVRLNTYYAWGDAAVDPAKMDLQNIATHELGHAVGMDDIYTTACSTVTMYGYSGEGDIAKRSLELPDITGLQRMYGA